jgi:hypothetical protein
MSLNGVLDTIWQAHSCRKTVAKDLLSKLGAKDTSQAALIDLLSILELMPDEVIYGNSDHSYTATTKASSLRLIPATSGDSCDVFYSDIQSGFRVEGVGFKSPASLKRNMSDVLLALQFCRDEIDSLLYVPPNMRQDVWEQAGADFQIDVAQLKFLASKFRRLSQMVAL